MLPDPSADRRTDPPGTAAGLPDALEEQVYDVLLGGAEADRRPAFERIVAAHPAHRAALLRLHRSLVGAEAALADTGLAEAPAPRAIGPYLLRRKLGEGGFGVVWLAEQSEPIARQVAIKLIRQGMDTTHVLRRFEAEREALARFDHPCIAKVLDAGRTADGSPYLVTEFVAGEPLVTFAQRTGLGLRERVALLAKVASGVQHAHQRGVIHRDLKPSNVLVTTVDGAALPKIIDFGIARALEGAAGEGERTRVGSLLGTPEYMSPEQALGSVDVDARTDVYALGVLLFELLVGDLPLGRARWRGASLTEIVDWIRLAEPPPPSARIGDPALARSVRGDLDSIVRMALAKDRERRYASVQQFVADLEAWLAHRPVAAAPPGVGYLLRKFVRRHRVEVAAAAVALGSLVGGLATSLVALQRARAAEQESRNLATARHEVLQQYEALADVVRERELRAQFEGLWPARPDRAAGFAAWLDAARQLVAGGGERARLAALARDRAGQNDDVAAGFLAAALEGLAVDVERFVGTGGRIEQAADGLAWAGEVAARTVDEPAAAWRQAADAIAASPRYRGLQLRPQLGLVPLGFDPDSGLYEFLHLQSGEPPARDAGGRIVPGPATGIVLVLVPGGETRIGAQAADAAGPHFDPDSARAGGVHEVRLAPYFLAKYEVTRAQYQRSRLPGGVYFEDGTECGQGPIGPLHPAENLSWLDADALARRFDLDLPTDAQWEFACRAGTTTVWPTGDSPRSLARVANIAGREIAQFNPRHPLSPEHFDPYGLTAPVGTFPANGFGLCDMAGNVAELCADSIADPTVRPRDGDGWRGGDDDRAMRVRGGSYAENAERARSAAFAVSKRDARTAQVGVRLARAIRN